MFNYYNIVKYNYENTTYSVSLFVILLLHAGLILFTYVPVIPTITASLGLIILGLLFYEIYKKYKYASFAKYLLIVSVVVLGLLVFSQIEYIPSKNIVVVDVFDKPIENVAMSIKDYVGETFNPAGGSTEYRLVNDIYATDKNGMVVTKSRFYFGEKKAKSVIVSVNDNVKIFPKGDFDSKSFSFSGDKNYQIVLAPIKEDYRKCDSITDKNKQSECLVYSLFYNAVKEKNPELCRLYDDEAVKNALNGQHFFYLSREDEVKNECLMLVDGIINDHPEVCNKIKNNNSRYFNDQCKCLFNSQYCEYYYKSEFDIQRPLYMKDVHNYLCDVQLYASPGDIRYRNYLRYFDTASGLYRKMFCN